MLCAVGPLRRHRQLPCRRCACKSREADFYVDGSRYYSTMSPFSASLVGRAFAGETASASRPGVEKDGEGPAHDHVPFIIILLIPLSPVGHVFAFAIQRFFPDFFPSCYTERRQNLVKRTPPPNSIACRSGGGERGHDLRSRRSPQFGSRASTAAASPAPSAAARRRRPTRRRGRRQSRSALDSAICRSSSGRARGAVRATRGLARIAAALNPRPWSDAALHWKRARRRAAAPRARASHVASWRGVDFAAEPGSSQSEREPRYKCTTSKNRTA